MPVVLGMWSCSVTILVCLTIWDLLGFVLLGLLFRWACHARSSDTVLTTGDFYLECMMYVPPFSI